MAFASLSLPPMEEPMEMSSPAAGQHLDGDIDIDFDDYGADQTNDDEHMLEDGDPMRPGTAVTDDMMADVDHPQVTSVPTTVEEEMQDSDEAAQPVEQQMNDEELIDYEDEFYPDPPHEALVGTTFQAQDHNGTGADTLSAPVVENSLLMEKNAAVESDQVDEEIVRRAEDVTVEPPSDTLEATTFEARHSAIAEESDQVQPPVDESAALAQQEDAPPESIPAAPNAQTTGESTIPAEDVGAPEGTTSPAVEQTLEQEVTASPQKMAPQHLGTIDVSGGSVADAPPTPTDQTLHAMSIAFGKYQWPLFKSRSQPDGLLKDDNLLNVSLADLLHNVRDRLALKVSADDMVTDTRDLVLNFDIFGLTVAESSLHASATSLNDVLAVYLTLHENDGITEHDAPPLFMTLTTQINFHNSIASLKQLAATGAGLPSVPDHVDDDTAEIDQEEDTSAEILEAKAAQLEGGETTYDPEHDPEESEVQEDLTGQIYEYYEEDHEDREDYEGYEDDEPASGDQEDAQPTDDGHDESFQDNKVDNPLATQLTSLVEVTEPSGPLDSTVEETEVAAEPKSDNSSSGVRAHVTSNSTGEYPLEDLIDWDDVDLTSDNSELYIDNGEDDYSAAVSADQLNPQEETHDNAVDDPDQNDEAAGDVLEFASEYFDGEDQPHDDGDESVTKHDPDHEEQYDNAVDSVDSTNQAVDSTDVLDVDHTSYTEGDEQYDTAFDLLDDDGNEPFNDNEDAADIPSQSQAPELDEDDIGFDLDEEDVAPASPSPATSTPRHGKRPLEEVADDEDRIDFDEPELKKARAD
ncbi:hypothetical protein Slin15195_G032050 [Septoria linicola]|uniref:Uncharacterized protein n=1 Tax=Septoria linicola TaxID=215465 RepID=A0A9Q9ASE6_9PEZI|nr:hypothetical protein Slin14017_G031070 [Septoria linicola]USW49886.1 hypothetical protein Slin15195_G032050 [Septoria linicola]